MFCPYCGKKAKWCENKAVYGRNFGESYMIYLCKPCNAYVGCHKNTRNALGSMANAHLRLLRRKCHLLIDPYWRNKQRSRKEIYALISEWYGDEFHVGWLREKDCEFVLKNLKLDDLIDDKKYKLLEEDDYEN